jgi:hypothetical protein
VLVVLLAVVYKATRDLDFQYNVPELIPGGIPVDLDAAARKQHEAAMGPAAAGGPVAPALVQILPLAAAPAAVKAESDLKSETEPRSGNETLGG